MDALEAMADAKHVAWVPEYACALVLRSHPASTLASIHVLCLTEDSARIHRCAANIAPVEPSMPCLRAALRSARVCGWLCARHLSWHGVLTLVTGSLCEALANTTINSLQLWRLHVVNYSECLPSSEPA